MQERPPNPSACLGGRVPPEDDQPCGYLAFVLHAHLPYVRHPEYERFLEERWLFEALTETYLPLVSVFDRLERDKLPFRLTLSLSPTLCAMLEDELLRVRYLEHLELCLRLSEAEMERTRSSTELHRLAALYRGLFEQAREVFEQRCGTRVVPVLREYAERGRLELITAAGTHPFLPALDPVSQRAHVLASVHEHTRRFGQRPRGMWLPECGYCPGLDRILVEAGIRYTVLETHGVEHARPRPQFGVLAPIYCPSGLAVFGRNPATSRLVWSSTVGYPGDPWYREYYRDIGFELDPSYLRPYQYAPDTRSPTGIKYYRVTGRGPHKELYHPERARETAAGHARHFVDHCLQQVRRARGRMPVAPVVVSPYDAELFGHWWFEGPEWLYQVLREVATGTRELGLVTPGDYLSVFPVHQRAEPAPSSWGHGGYGAQWVNGKTVGLYRWLHEARLRLTAAVRRTECPNRLEHRALAQAARELMLAESSDWSFAITNGTTEQYARRRFFDHLSRCHELLAAVESHTIHEEQLEALEFMDALFPELDPGLWAEPNRGSRLASGS